MEKTFSRNLVPHEHQLKEAVRLSTEELHDMFIVAKHKKIFPCQRSFLALFSPLAARILSEVPCCIAPTLFLTDYHEVNIRTLLQLLKSGQTVLSQNINADMKVVTEVAQLLEISLTDINIGPYLDNPLSGTFQIEKETNNCGVKTEIKKEVEELKEAQEHEKCDEPDECDYIEEDENENNSSCGTIKIEEAGRVHSKVSVGIETNDDMIELETNVVTTEETAFILQKEVSEKTGGIVANVQEINDEDMIIEVETNVATIEKTASISQKEVSEKTGVIVTTVQETNDGDMIIDLVTNVVTTEKNANCLQKKVSEKTGETVTIVQEKETKSSQNYDGLGSISSVTSIAHKSVSYHSREGTFISPSQHCKLNNLHVYDTCIKSDSKENRDHKRIPVKIKIKERVASHSFDSARDTRTEKEEFRGGFDTEAATKISNSGMTGKEMPGSIFVNHEDCHFWDKEDGATDLATSALKDEDGLKEHMQIHSREKRYLCLSCPKMFKKISNLKSHALIHTGEKPFPCEFCAKKFTQSGQLKIHTRIHNGEKPFKCGDCLKTFKSSAELKTHATSHTGEKPFKCGVCPKQFMRSNLLKEHTRIHTGEKPLQCMGCNKRFAYESSLRYHKKICSVKL